MLLVQILRQEFERKRQIEIERQLARQREIRMQAQDQKIRMEEQRLAARLVDMDVENYQTIVFGKAFASIKALCPYLT